MNIIFGGDFFYKNGKKPIISHEKIKEEIKKSDAFILNLEGPVINKKNSSIKKIGPIKQQSENSLKIIKEMGVSIVNLANNHIMDGGYKGLKNTLNLLRKTNIDFFGLESYLNSENKKNIQLIKNENKISIIGVAEEEFNGKSGFGCGSFIFNPINLWKIITNELNKDKIIIVVLHGGVEHEHLPPPWLRNACHWLIDIGVTSVITHHPHVPGYVEMYKNKPIAWSLGNFWFSSGGGKNFNNQIGYVFKLNIIDKETINYKIYPYYSDYKIGEIREMKKIEINKWDEIINNIKNNLSNIERYNQWWENLIFKKQNSYLIKYSLAPFPKIISKVIYKIIKLLKIKNKWELRQLNGLRCKTHQEMWKESLIKRIK